MPHKRSNEQKQRTADSRDAAILRKTLLLRAGVEGREIARRTRLSRTLVSFVINGHRRNARIEREISRVTQTPREELWSS